jgi:hypothetical protein
MAGYAGAFIPAAKRPFNARSGGVFRAVFRVMERLPAS